MRRTDETAQNAHSNAFTMAGWVQVRARWSTRARRPSPAAVVRSCSKVLGSSMASAMYLGEGVSNRRGNKGLRHAHGELLNHDAEAVVVSDVGEACTEAGVAARG